MNQKIFRMTLMVALICLLAGCNMDQEVTDVFDLTVSQIQQLYQPEDGKTFPLSSSSAVPKIHFEWEPAMTNDNSMVLYEVKFDSINGDFSNPIAVFPSSSNGRDNFLEIGHKDMNRIATAAGIESYEWGDIKWTVFSSKGINPMQAASVYTFRVRRLAGITPPERVYLTGAATEAGDNLEDAILMRRITDEEAELFTQLEAGQTFRFVDALSGTPTVYGLVDEETLVQDPDGTCTVENSGVYKISLDFGSAVVKFSEIERVGFLTNYANELFDMTYAGSGVWELLDQEFPYVGTGGQQNPNGDDRYKFRMYYVVGHPATGQPATEWRSYLPNDAKPGATPSLAWYYTVEKLTPTRDDYPYLVQWTDNEIWKREGLTWSDAIYNIRLILKPDTPYTHTFVRTEK